MPIKHSIVRSLALASLALPAFAQLPSSPAGPAGRVTDPGMGAGTGLSMGGNTSPEVRSRVEQQMQAMQDLRSRMMSATTPEQRQSLMNEHMRLMDENMSLMQLMMMGSGGQLPSLPASPGTAPVPGPGTGGGAGSAAPSGSPGSVR